MAGIADIRRDVRSEFNKHIEPNALDESGRIVFGEVFDLTVGLFAKKCARLKPPIHVWKNKKFKSFILGQTKKIAIEANRHATTGIISGAIFNRASLKVMRRTQTFCKLAIKKGRIRDIRSGHVSQLGQNRSDGEVCSTYLATQRF